MRKKVLKFYATKGFHLSKLIDKKPDTLNKLQVQAAAVKLYKMIKDGMEIKDLNIPRRIYELAKIVKYQEFVRDQQILEEHKQIITRLKDQRFFAYIIAFCSLFVSAVALIKAFGGF